VLLLGACSGDSKKPATPTPESSPLASPTVTTVPCPVDTTICEYAVAVEAAAREGNLQQRFPANAESVQRALIVWRGERETRLPRLVTIGCPIEAGRADCSSRFGLTFSSLREEEEHGSGSGLAVFLFTTAPDGFPSLEGLVEPLIGRNLVFDGGDVCLKTLSLTDSCVDYRMVPFSTGAGVDGPPPPAPSDKLLPLRQLPNGRSIEMTLGEPYRIQGGELWYFKYLCDACGPGPLPSLYRAYRNAAGELVIDDLKARVDPLGLGVVVAFTANWQSGDVWIATCAPGCGPTDGSGGFPGYEETVYRSRDGGITWTRDGSLPPQTGFVGIAGGLVTSTWSPDHQSQRFRYYPDGPDLEPPRSVSEQVYPVALNPSTLIWANANGNYYDGAGTRLFGPLFDGFRPQVAVADPQYQHTYLTWVENGGRYNWLEQPYYSYVGHVDRDGQMRDLYGLPGDTMWITGELPRTGDAPPGLFGRFRFGTSVDYLRDVSFGGVLDLANGQVHRFAELDSARPPGSFVYMEDLVSTPPAEGSAPRTGFLRVSGAETCLNIRRDPALSASVLACLADDVLVADLGQTQDAGGTTWTLVRTPGGQSGWASRQYLR
jgi:hypothetical protein